MRAALVLLILGWSSAVMAQEAGCELKAANGDAFVFTDNSFVWLYKPVASKEEACAYGIDMDVGAHTITCDEHHIDAVVFNDDTGAKILDRHWDLICPQGLGM
jgi:hypothetical protein